MVRCTMRFVCLLAVLLLCACPEEFEGAAIESLTITPNSITPIETGMTDEYFTIEIVVSGFEDDIDPDETLVFLQDPPENTRCGSEERARCAVAGSIDLDGETITLNMVVKTWLGGLDPGVYNIGAEVTSPTQSAKRTNLATVTIEEN